MPLLGTGMGLSLHHDHDNDPSDDKGYFANFCDTIHGFPYPSPPSTLSKARSRRSRPSISTLRETAPQKQPKLTHDNTFFPLSYPISPPPSEVRGTVALPNPEHESTSDIESDTDSDSSDYTLPLSPCSPFASPKPSWDPPELPSSPPLLALNLFAEYDDEHIGLSQDFQTPDLLPSIDLEDEDDDEPLLSSPGPSLPSSPSAVPSLSSSISSLSSSYSYHYPSSPSRRGSFVSLDDEEEEISVFSPPSPAPSLLSLPDGDDEAEYDFDGDDDDSQRDKSLHSEDDPLDLLNPIPTSIQVLDEDEDDDIITRPFPPTGSLLLLDNPASAPGPDEPPEHCVSSLSLTPDEIASSPDPDTLSALLDLRRRCQTAERKAKAVEVALSSPLPQSQSPTSSKQAQQVQRNEVRRQRKRDKERSKEVGALVRLKMRQFAELDAALRAYADSTSSATPTPTSSDSEKEKETSPITSMTKLVEAPSGSKGARSPRLPKVSPSKTIIRSMEQLVARMVFRRREAPHVPSASSSSSSSCGSSHNERVPASSWSSSKSRLGSAVRRHSPLRISWGCCEEPPNGGRSSRSNTSAEGDEDGEDGEDEDDALLSTLKGLPGL